MKAFLFAWNPVKWPWPELPNDIIILRETGIFVEAWSCSSHKSVRPGDRAYLIRLGKQPMGIMGSGFVSSEPFTSDKNGVRRTRVLINFEVLLDPDREAILPMEELRSGKLKDQHWSTQASGISIKPHVVEELDALWLEFLARR